MTIQLTPKGWIREHQNWPVLEVTTSYLQGNGVEIRIESVNKDNSHSWVWISHGSTSWSRDDHNEQETSETKTEEFALKTNVLAFASQSKAKAKPRRPTSACSSTRIVLICEKIWTGVEPGTQSNLAYPVAKRISILLRHGQLLREEDRAIEFRRSQDCLRHELRILDIGLVICGRARWQEAEATRKDFNTALIHQEQSLYFRALQGHSGFKLIDPSWQDTVSNPENFFEYIHLVEKAINLQSIVNSGLMLGGQNLSRERQTVFFLPVDPMDKKHKDPDTIDLEAPRPAQNMHEVWKKHQNTVYWVDINLLNRKI